MNLITLTGRLTKDVLLNKKTIGMQEIYYTNNSVAVNVYAGKNDKGEVLEATLFYNFALFNNDAQYFCKYAEKGQKILLNGKLQVDFYTDKNGNEANSQSINVSNFELLEKPQNTQNKIVNNTNMQVKVKTNESNNFSNDSSDVPF